MKTKILILIFMICLFALVGCSGQDQKSPVDPSASAGLSAVVQPTAAINMDQAAIREAVLEHNRGNYVSGEFPCESHVLITMETQSDGEKEDALVTYYLMVLYLEYDHTEDGPKAVSGGSMPVALTFMVDEKEGKYTLLEYWEPQGGKNYWESLRSKFPAYVPDEDLDTQKNIHQLIQDCDAQAKEYFALGGD